jgi:hypothetical protein
MSIEARFEQRQTRYALEEHRRAVAGLEARCAKARDEAAKAQRTVDFYTNVLADLSDADKDIDCAICYDHDRTHERVVVTACGHRYCVECASQWFATNRACPMCKCKLALPRDLRSVARARPVAADAAATTTDVVAAINVHGSKLVRAAALIRTLLAAEPTTKIIVFAQFDRLLKLVARALGALDVGAGVEVIEVRGTVHQCQHAIDRFRTEPSVRVMLLSSDATISGITLVEANHVVAVHPPFTEDKDTARECALLEQAVGRVRRATQTRPCHLWSLVTDDTLEEAMYTRQTAYIRDHHTDVTFEDDDDDADDDDDDDDSE